MVLVVANCIPSRSLRSNAGMLAETCFARASSACGCARGMAQVSLSRKQEQLLAIWHDERELDSCGKKVALEAEHNVRTNSTVRKAAPHGTV